MSNAYFKSCINRNCEIRKTNKNKKYKNANIRFYFIISDVNAANKLT